jgi:hypothetical protein
MNQVFHGSSSAQKQKQLLLRLVECIKCWAQTGLTGLAASGHNSLLLSWHMNEITTTAAAVAATAARGAAGAGNSNSSKLVRRRE